MLTDRTATTFLKLFAAMKAQHSVLATAKAPKPPNVADFDSSTAKDFKIDLKRYGNELSAYLPTTDVVPDNTIRAMFAFILGLKAEPEFFDCKEPLAPGDTNFDFNKDTLKPAGKAELDKLVADMKQAKQIDAVTVVGHTDSVGSDAYNQRLSERRAATVKNYLVSKGVPAGIISASGRGESQPIADNKTAAGRAQNRRVEITVDVTP